MDPLEAARRLFFQALEHHQAHRLAEAEALYRQALALAPERVSLLVNLSAVLVAQQRFSDALPFCRRALRLEPDHPEALEHLALCRAAGESPAAALETVERALAARPADAELHNNRGTLLRAAGRPDEALAAFDASLALQPDAAGVLANRASVLAALGRHREALQGFLRALQRAPDLAPAGQGLVALLRADARLLDDATPELDALLARAIRVPWGRPQAIAPLLIARLRRQPALAAASSRVDAAWPRRLSWSACLADDDEAVLGNPLLLALLESALAADVGLERLLVTLRAALLQRALHAGAQLAPVLLRFQCALARQCFLNEYVYAPGDDEAAAAGVLQARVEAMVAAAEAPPAVLLATLAAQRPLHGIDGSAWLAGRSWPAPLDDVIEQQVRQPALEQELIARLPQLTPIEDATSRAVRRQYEENPYPRWVALPPQTTRESLASYLQRRVPGIEMSALPRAARIEALNAGCGTGQHPIEMALRIDGIQVLAIDLSRRSLAYAARMAQQLGVGNVVFAQADLLELHGLERNFDLIESSGVLHHLAEPGRGLAALARMLREHGLLRLSLYSATGRRAVVAARARVAERGFAADVDGIRRFRAELMRDDADPLARRITALADFYATSECRDLVFHVQEHRLSLPAIGALLQDHGLEFVGLEPEQRALAAFRAAYPSPASLRRLDDWHAFEQAHPEAFAGMYTLWARLKP